jgi:hypothetical protein
MKQTKQDKDALQAAIAVIENAGGKVRADGTGLSFDQKPPEHVVPAIQYIANHLNDKNP